MNRRVLAPLTVLLLTAGGAAPHDGPREGGARPPAGPVVSAARAPFPNFESGPLAPLLLTPDGERLLVLNTPDHRLEIHRTFPVGEVAGGGGGGTPAPPPGAGPAPGPGPQGPGGARAGAGPGPGLVPTLAHEHSVFVGLEPVAMLAHPEDASRVFVANHVSDTVSVVDVDAGVLVATIPTGDEPAGLAVAGGRLFVACARAPKAPLAPGQVDPGPLTDNVVCVYEAQPPYAFVANVAVDAVKPRDIVASGDTVLVVPQNSGNHTTLLDETATATLGLEQTTPDALDPPFEVNPVLEMPELVFPAFTRGWSLPNTGRIVFDWEYPALVPQLLDLDVIPVDAAGPTVLPSVTTGVMTTQLDAALQPGTGTLWVVGTDAHNRRRFEPMLQGDVVDNVVAVVEPGVGVTARLELEPPLTDAEHAQPAAIAFGTVGGTTRAYVAALGTGTVLVFDAQTRALVGEVEVGALPSGLAVDEARGLLYVLLRGGHAVAVHEADGAFAPLSAPRPLAYDPEPPIVRAGRMNLYDASPEAGRGTGNASCASCHVFGHADQLAWDLGDPGGSFGYYFPDVLAGFGGFPGQVVTDEKVAILNPLKGPMVTQSLRGLMDPDTKDDLPLHWRGDRRVFGMFQGAFEGLLGGSGVSRADMQAFATFVRTIEYAPNPFQRRDRSYAGEALDGLQIYGLDPDEPAKPYNEAAPDVFCVTCHEADFEGKTDFTGSRPTASQGSFQQIFNTAQLRMVYEKDFKLVSGFGALHDGAVDGARGFMDFTVPNGGLPTFPNFTTADKDAVGGALLHQWDHGMAPLVGAQFTMDAQTVGQLDAFLDLAEAQAQPPQSNVELIVRGHRVLGDGTIVQRGGLFTLDETGTTWGYRMDTGAFVDRETLALVATLDVGALTFTAVPPGMGERLGLDRDEDGLFDELERGLGADPLDPDGDGDGHADGAEVAAGSDPLDPASVPADALAPSVGPVLPLEVSTDAATLTVWLDEPATLEVALGTAPGGDDLGVVASPERRARHDVVLVGLPAATEVCYTVSATDAAGNVGVATGQLTTMVPLLHVADLSLVVTGGDPYVATATVTVHDHLDEPVDDVPVRVFWAGDLGGLDFRQDARTDPAGVATFELGPFSPAGPTTLAVSPAYVGSSDPRDPWFTGLGGESVESFFYFQPANATHYRSVELP